MFKPKSCDLMELHFYFVAKQVGLGKKIKTSF
jgi:hypothetical protein